MAGGGGAPVITSGTSRMSWPVPWMTWLRGQWVGGGLGPGELQGEWVGGGPGPGELQGEPPSGAVPALPPHAPFPRAFPHWPHRSASSSAAGQGPGASGCGAGGAASAWGTAGGAGWAPGRTLPPPLQGPPVPWPPPGPRRLPQDFWLSDRGSSGLRPLQVEPVAASGCLPQGPTVSLSRAPGGAAAADVLLRGPLASPGPGPGAPAWVGLPAHAESAHADKPPVPSSGTWPHPREPPMPVFPRSLPTAGSCCHPNRALRGPAPSPMLAGKAGSVPACPPSALHSHLHGAWHRRPPAGSCPLCGPAPLA